MVSESYRDCSDILRTARWKLKFGGEASIDELHRRAERQFMNRSRCCGAGGGRGRLSFPEGLIGEFPSFQGLRDFFRGFFVVVGGVKEGLAEEVSASAGGRGHGEWDRKL